MEIENVEDLDKEIENRGLGEKIKAMNDAGFRNKQKCLMFLLKNEKDE